MREARRRAAALALAACVSPAFGGPAPSPDALWPQAVAFPDAARIDVETSPGARLRVRGRAGAVPGGLPVLAACANSGAIAVATAAEDGSFEAELAGLPGSWVLVKFDPSAARWIRPRPEASPSADSMFRANTAPGVWLRAAAPEPPGEGLPFTVAGLADPGTLDFSLSGRLSGELRAGGSARVEGRVAVFASSATAPLLRGQSVLFDADLVLLFDRDGRARADAGFYFSNVLTPTGLPVQTKGAAAYSLPNLMSGPLEPSGDGGYAASVSWILPISSALPPGLYAFAVRARSPDQRAAPPPGYREGRQLVLTRGLHVLPRFRVGSPAPPRLTWALLTDVPGADGSRGTVAARDRGDFEVASGVVTQARAFIVPRVSKKDGRPLVYRLEPYLPMLAQGDRLVPNPPPLDLRLPSGELRARVRRPDGKTDVLGPAPFRAARSRAPATGSGAPLNGNSGALADVLQLSTASELFDYRFPLYGRYEIELEGSVEDARGTRYAGGGRYTVHVAERLDLEPAMLPMTPLQPGDAVHPGLKVLPGVPAEVEVSVRLLPGSDVRRARSWTFRGRANAFGTFVPPASAPPAILDEAGEFVVEAQARHLDADGVLRMGAYRWGQVVETPGAPLLARGRRGRIRMARPAGGLWFRSSRKTDGGHARYPYASGDVLWQEGDDSVIPVITAHDREGRASALLRELYASGPALRKDLDRDGPFEDRAQASELPLPLVSGGPLAPAADPGAIRVHGYFYGAAQRPGERVREVVSDDQGVQQHGYWFFDEPYAGQAGVGEQGDLANDFKFLFGGAVLRDRATGLRRYGIYASLWVQVPDDDPRGGRVFPPFQGRHGGPSGGPLMTLRGRPIDAFVVPLAARPGTILETGDRFSFSAQVAPTLGARVRADVRGPGGFRRAIEGRTNSIGWFYRPERDFTVTAPGEYRVKVEAVFDSTTSAGPLPPPSPAGTVLGAEDGAFSVYVVPRGSPALGTALRAGGAPRRAAVELPVRAAGGAGGRLRYTIAMPGFLLEEGERALSEGEASVRYDPYALRRDFPNIDAGPEGLADTVWVSVLAEPEGGPPRARQFTLQGAELHAR